MSQRPTPRAFPPAASLPTRLSRSDLIAATPNHSPNSRQIHLSYMQIRLYCYPIKTLLLLGKSTSPSHRCGHWRILSQVIAPIFLYDLPESYIITLATAKSLPQILGLGPEGVSGHAFCHVTLRIRGVSRE